MLNRWNGAYIYSLLELLMRLKVIKDDIFFYKGYMLTDSDTGILYTKLKDHWNKQR